MEETYKEINNGHHLELADRLSIIMGNVDQYCYEHPASDDDIKISLDEAMKHLWDAYQIAGSKI